MRYTVIGDIHAKPDNLDKVNTLFDIIEELGNPCIILGDLLDTKEIVRARCLNTYLERMAKSNLKFIVIVGNHDYFNLDCQDHSLQSLKLLSNVEVVDEPRCIDGMFFFPYMHDLEKFRECLKNVKGTLFCHADVKNFDYGNGFISENGLDLKDLKNFKTVISGHYHKYQQKGNLTYLGTPFSHSFGESNQDKYIGLFDSKTNELELLESPFPKHVTLEVECKGDKPSLKIPKNDHVRVVLKGNQENIDKVPRIEGVKYIEKPSINTELTTVIDETQSLERQFKTWAEEIVDLDKTTIEAGLELLKEVSGV